MGVFPDDDDYVWRERWIDLLRPPLIKFVQVRYFDIDNQLQTLDPASWPQLIGKQVYSVHLTANVGLE